MIEPINHFFIRPIAPIEMIDMIDDLKDNGNKVNSVATRVKTHYYPYTVPSY